MSDLPSTSASELRPTTSRLVTRSSDQLRFVESIGHVSHLISGAKLPSNRQILKVFFYNMRFVHFGRHNCSKQSAQLVVDAAIIFWQQARIPTRGKYKCQAKLLKLYDVWKNVHKESANKRSDRSKLKVNNFKETLDDLFDIASANVLNEISIEEDKNFLLMQRQKGRPGCMAGVDMKLYGREQRSQQRKEKEESRKRKCLELNNQSLLETGYIESEDEDEFDDEIMDTGAACELNTEDDDDYSDHTKHSRGRHHWISSRLTVVLDKAKVSCSDAVHILIACADDVITVINNAVTPLTSVGELVINRFTIYKLRKENRKLETEKAQTEFIAKINSVQSLVIHWDGKLLPDLLGRSKVDRIAILASYEGTSKYLGAPKVPAGTGENMAKVVHEALIKWDIVNKVSAMGFDTTTSNTGQNIGACTLLQNKLDRKLIQFACRHHMLEIVLKHVFEVKLSVTSGPDVPVLNRFAAEWENLDHKLFKGGLEDPIVRSKISNADCEAITIFCNLQLHQTQIRADYKELLQLTIMFLGEVGGSFRIPGPTSHARFMGKAIYILKIYLFREQFTLSKRESNGLRDICVFLVRLYVKAWFTCTKAILAPNQDINFLKDSIAYAKIDPAVSEAVLHKWKNHLWYLAPETVALAFFDSDVSLEEKRNMVRHLQSPEPIVKLQDDRKISDPKLLQRNNLSDFVSYKTKNFFDAFGLTTEFLKHDPSIWETNEDYLDALDVCREFFVVNDTAERGVKFMNDYNRILTKDEEQNQFILQCIKAYRRKYPSHNKSHLI